MNLYKLKTTHHSEYVFAIGNNYAEAEDNLFKNVKHSNYIKIKEIVLIASDHDDNGKIFVK